MNPTDTLPINMPGEEIISLCKQWKIRKLSLFGSVLRDNFGPDSDVDVLVEFEPDAGIGWKFVELQEQLSALIGRTVDLNTPGFLSRHMRDKVLNSALVIYERTG